MSVLGQAQEPVLVSCIGNGAGFLSVFGAAFGQKCQNWEELLEKFKITSLGSGLKAVPLKVTPIHRQIPHYFLIYFE